MGSLLENITNKDIKQLFNWTQSKPLYLPFYKACFRVADLTGQNIDKVIAVCRPVPEIRESFKFKLEVVITQPINGKEITF